MALSDELAQVTNSIAGVGTAIATKNSTIKSGLGSERGLVMVAGSASLTGDVFGYLYQSPNPTASTPWTAPVTTTLPAANAANAGKRLTFSNFSAYNWNLTAANINSSLGFGVTSIALPPGWSITLEHDGASYNAVGGAGSMGGVSTVSSAAPSGGKSGDIWYQV